MSDNRFSIVICSIWELSIPGARVGSSIFYRNLQHLGVVRPRRQCRIIDFLLYFTASASYPTLVPGSDNQISIVIYSIWELSDRGARVGSSIFYCNLQHLGVIRPRRQCQIIDFLLYFTASASYPTLVPESDNRFSIVTYSI